MERGLIGSSIPLPDRFLLVSCLPSQQAEIPNLVVKSAFVDFPIGLTSRAFLVDGARPVRQGLLTLVLKLWVPCRNPPSFRSRNAFGLPLWVITRGIYSFGRSPFSGAPLFLLDVLFRPPLLRTPVLISSSSRPLILFSMSKCPPEKAPRS